MLVQGLKIDIHEAWDQAWQEYQWQRWQFYPIIDVSQSEEEGSWDVSLIVQNIM